jgi:hypothetical protein
MRKLFLALLILLIPAWCWGATVWTANVGGTVYYDSSATSCSDVTAADTASDLEGASTVAGVGGTFNICAGTYSGAMIDASDGFDSTSNSQTIKMVGDVILDGSAINDHTFRFATNTGNILDMSAGTLYIYPYYAESAGTNYGMRLEVAITENGTGAITIDGNNTLHRGLYDSGSNTISSLTVKNCANTSACIFTTASNTTLDDFAFTNNAGPIYPATSGTFTINRLNISGNTLTTGILAIGADGINTNLYYGKWENNASFLIYNTTGTHNIFNVDFIGNNLEAIKTTGTKSPAVVVKNCMLLANGLDAGGNYYNINHGATGASASCTVSNTLSLSPPTVLLGDTPSDYSYSEAVTEGGGNIKKSPLIKAGRRPAIVVFGTDDYQALDTYAPTIVGPKLAAKGWGGTFAVDTDGMNSARWTTAATLVAAGHEIASHGKTHTDLTTVDASTLATECSASKTAIETNITGYTCKTLVCPYNGTSATVRTAIAAAGYIGARGDASSDSSTSMASFNIYNARVKGLFSLYGDSADPTQATVDARLGALLEWAKYSGSVLFLYAHNATECNAACWDKTLALVAQSDVQVMTLKDAIAYIKANGTDSGDHLTWTRTFTDQSDYHLSPASPAINAGTDVSLTSDFDGKPIRGGLPDIGAYEFQGKPWLPKMPRMFKRLKIGSLDVPEIYIKPISLVYAGI